MRRDAEAIIARARALIGVRFRPQGRKPAAGLDCVGLVAAALGAPAPADYRPHGATAARIAAELRKAGLAPADAMTAGDVVAMRTGPRQVHLGIWTGAGLIHADAGLRRVVERPGAPAWPIIGIWRAGEG
jgi:cell wall-associated NlpC family hydrolase